MYVPARCGQRGWFRCFSSCSCGGSSPRPSSPTHFGVSIRTIHRDVESLGAAGVPVEALRGPAGGYRLSGGYRTKLTGLTAAEAEALFVAPAPAAELGLGGVLTNARLKVLSALPPDLQERASRAERYFHLDTRGWFRAEDTVPHLPTIAAATWQGRRLSARYREGSRVVQRTLDPLGLVLKGGAWYLVAHRSAGMRVYRVSRFASVRVREEGFERPEGFELASYWDEWSRSFEASRPQVEVKIRASELVRRFLPGELHGEDGVLRRRLREPRRSLSRAAQVRSRRGGARAGRAEGAGRNGRGRGRRPLRGLTSIRRDH